MSPVRERCEVLERRRTGAYQALTLVAPTIAEDARPGQFVHLLAGEDRSFPLRRPFSVHRVERPGGAPGGPRPRMGTVEVVFDVVGAGTRALARLRPHDVVDALGPLGRPFDPPEAPAGCLLVGGGYGTAPLLFLATELRARRCRVDFVIGAATAGRLLDAMEAKRLGHSLTVTTDDGSAGRRGLVTDPLPGLLAATGAERVYACGPMPMLAAVSRLAAAAGVPCQVAVEEQMACGTGICFSCVLPVGGSGGLKPSPPVDRGSGGLKPSPPVDRESGGTRMARSCLEGPVFDGTAIAWAELGHPDLEGAVR
jgi:dihydroorotate dehydrogenase electron transfer subunit